MIFPDHGGLGKSFRSFALNPLLYADLYYANSFFFFKFSFSQELLVYAISVSYKKQDS